MTTTALQALKLASEGSDEGFFLMVEGSRIDHAGHASDLVAHLHDILAWYAPILLRSISSRITNHSSPTS